MTYLPTQEDLALLTNRSKDLYCRIDLLDHDYCVIDSLEGLAMSGSISIDADSDTRRTFNVDIHPSKNSAISDYSVEDWMNKMVRVYIGIKSPTSKLAAENKVVDVDAYINKLNALQEYMDSLDDKIVRSTEYLTAALSRQIFLGNIRNKGYDKYGNINNLNRPVIYWTSEIAKQYRPFLRENPDIVTGDEEYSTVLGSDDEYSGLQIAYTPLLVSQNTLIPITNSVMQNYIERVVEIAKKKSGGLNANNILEADRAGLNGYVYRYSNSYKDDIHIHDMIAAVEGQNIGGTVLSKADVSAIAGWSEEELKEEYKTSSVFVGSSMHDIQGRVIELKNAVDKAYDKEWEKLADEKILSQNAETVSSCYVDINGVHWYSKGVYVIKENGITYDATTNTLSLSCTDLTILLDGTFGGQLTGSQTIIYRFAQTADHKDDRTHPLKIKNCIVDTFKLSDLTKYNIDYWERYIPHDIEYNTGTTIWQILTELRDLYYPFEMYFDDDTFVCKEIPSGINDPVVLNEDTFADLVISENASVDYSQVKNCVEVFGATIESDLFAYGDSQDDSGNAVDNYVELVTDSGTLNTMWDDMKKIWPNSFVGQRPNRALLFHFKDQDFLNSNSISISFIAPTAIKMDEDIFFEIINTNTLTTESEGVTTTKTTVQKLGVRHLYKTATDKYGNDQRIDKDITLREGEYYIFKIEATVVDNIATSSISNSLLEAIKKLSQIIMNLNSDKEISADNSTVIYKENRFYFLGQQQSHAMLKFVDKMPTDAQIELDKRAENCSNLKYITVTSPTDLTGSYNSRMTIDRIGRRNEVLSGGDYENYTTNERAMEVGEYKLWQGTRLTDTVQLKMLLVPWLDVNERIDYAARYMKTKSAVEWIVKKIDFNLGEGTMDVTLSRYYPYYPYIVQGKYDEDYVS